MSLCPADHLLYLTGALLTLGYISDVCAPLSISLCDDTPHHLVLLRENHQSLYWAQVILDTPVWKQTKKPGGRVPFEDMWAPQGMALGSLGHTQLLLSLHLSSVGKLVKCIWLLRR